VQFKNEKDRLIDMVEYAGELGLITVTDELLKQLVAGERTENQYILDLSTHNFALEPFVDALTRISESIDINLASGEALDCLGRLVGVTRFPAQPGMVDVVFSVELHEPADIHIPAGTRVYCDGLDGGYGVYVTSEDATLPSGVMSGTVRCENSEYGVCAPLPEECVTRFEGFDLSVTNPSGGTGGRNIEEDWEYRERVRSWSSALNIGTRACIDNYLGMYDGLDSYRLVPRYDGVGTLKIVCDTLPTLLDSISSDVYENCMLVTDYPPLCVLPESTNLSSLELTVSKGDGVTGYTDDELKQLIVAQVETFVNGGVKRDSTRMSGLGIGDDFIPSQLVQYLLGEFPELVNIVPDSMEVIPVPDTNHFNIEQTEVVIE
jgi:hypothetical protein